MTGQISFKINTLQARYGLASRQAIYDRIHGLNISPIKKGEISEEQLDLLDKLDKFLLENPNAAIADFPKQPLVEEAVVSRMVESETISDDYRVLSSILSKVVEIVQSVQQPRSCITAYRELEEAAAHGWMLPTSKVVTLIGVAPHGEVFARGSFAFARSGKIGREAGWKVLSKNTTGVL